MEYMVSNFGKKFFMIGSDYAWPRVTNLVTKRKLEELGGEVVGEVYIPFNTPQYESVLRDIRNSGADIIRSEEHTSELQSLMRISYAVFCLKKKNNLSSILPPHHLLHLLLLSFITYS